MTRRRIGSSLIAVLTALLLAPLPAPANDRPFSQGGYEVVFDEPMAANRANILPIVLTAGPGAFSQVSLGDLRVRCSAYTGKKGVRVLIEGSVSEGDDLEAVGDFPLRSKKTKRNGYAVFEYSALDLVPVPGNTNSGELVAIMNADIQGAKKLEMVEVNCTLGAAHDCTASATTACSLGGRMMSSMEFVDPFDGSRRQAQASSSGPGTVIFSFPPSNASSRTIQILDRCGSSDGPRAFQVDGGRTTSVSTTLTITDVRTGVTRVFGPADAIYSDAFDTCP